MIATHSEARSALGARAGSPAAQAKTRWVHACIIIAVVLGVFFRFYHIDRKVYWEDETYTSLHVLGVTEADVVNHASRYVNAAALRAVLHPERPLTTTIGDTIHSLAAEDPQHPPLYYIGAHLWVKLFGDSVASIRTLSAIIGVAALPCMYWLCLELFGSTSAAWIGVGLFAVSPIAVLFSQEAREYILWSLAVVVMSATFLRALRLPSVAAWAAYAAALAVSLYVFPISGALAIGNVCVAAAIARRNLRAVIAPVAASLAGCVAFLPWLAVVYHNAHKIDHAMGLTLRLHGSKLEVIKQFVGIFKLNFLDFNLASGGALNALFSISALALIGYALYHLIRTAPRRTSLFIVSTAIFAAVPFVLPDLLMGQHFTGNARYFMPLYIATDLALVYLFASTLTSAHLGGKQLRALTLLFAAVIAGRSASCAVSANAQTWWSKFGERSIEVARSINRADRPLLLSSEFMERPLSLSNYLDPKIALQLHPRCYLCSRDDRGTFDLAVLKGPNRYSDVIVLGPSAEFGRDVKAAIVAARSRARYNCIDDQLDDKSSCTGTLHLWPQ